ncbi:MAG: hypothetical protein EOT04_00950 [Candidatus Chaera renei]|uniref:Uncharacterized protein n=1 Tax=Candidatus Chaera renei TaxID=2506947 RepID=A0A4V1J7N5_9BACT|nr:MAG: hypothetical protein EOT04_00950 [Candidatus Chaera renei]
MSESEPRAPSAYKDLGGGEWRRFGDRSQPYYERPADKLERVLKNRLASAKGLKKQGGALAPETRPAMDRDYYQPFKPDSHNRSPEELANIRRHVQAMRETLAQLRNPGAS